MKRFFILTFKFIVVIFALVGFGLIGAYAAVALHLTNTKGIVDTQADNFWKDGKTTAVADIYVAVQKNTQAPEDIFFNKKNYCLLKAIKSEYPGEFGRIVNLAMNNQKELAQKNLDVLSLALSVSTDSVLSVIVDGCNADTSITNISKQNFEVLGNMVDTKSPFAWASSDEWNFFQTSVLKDKDILDKIQAETGINSRILVSQLMAEQMRLFYSDRPWFKKAIEPLKVLGSMTQLSWGILGIKSETAMAIEANLKNPNSEFYPGKEFENMLDFKTKNISQERFARITDNNDHTFAYLYAAIYNKEIEAQWQKAGFDISNRPEILATLFNIGFSHSKPSPDPQIGGAELNIGGATYSFGRLAYEFYYSDKLLDEFPQQIQNNTQEATQITNSLPALATNTQVDAKINVNQSPAWCHTFNKNLGYADSGTDEVSALHIALQKEGIAFAPDTGNIYGGGTSLALVHFQTEYLIAPASGFVGNKTREQLNKLYGCTAVAILKP